VLHAVVNETQWCMAWLVQQGPTSTAVTIVVLPSKGPTALSDLKLDRQVPLPTSSVLAAVLVWLRAVTLQRPSNELQSTGEASAIL
jgi:hypothetical protein